MRNKTGETPFRWMLRRYIFLFITIFMISFAVFPMQGIIRTMRIREWLEEAPLPLDPALRNAYTRELTTGFVYSPLNLEMLCVLFAGMGFAAAMVLFRHLFSRKQGMMYAALPVTRSKDYLLRFGVYLVYGLLPVALCLGIHPLMVRAQGLWGLFDFPVYLGRAAATLLMNLYGFALGALCASLFGTLWSAALGGLLVAVSGELTVFCWRNLAANYLNSLYVTVRTLFRFSPVYSFYKYFYSPGELPLWPGLLAILLLLALGWAAYRKVMPEHAGQTLNRKALEPLLLGWGTVLGATAGAIILVLYLSEEFMLYLGLVFGAALAWMIMRMLLEQRIHLSLRRWQIPAGVLACLVLLCLGMRLDVTGFNRYLPEANQVSAVRIWPGQQEAQEMRFESPEEVEAALQWAGQARTELTEARRAHAFNPSFYGSAVVMYDLKDGRTVARQYDYPEDQRAVLPALRVMAKSWSRQMMEHLPNLPRVNYYSRIPSFGYYGAEFQDVYGFSADESGLPRVKTEEVRDALRADLAERTLESLQEPALMTVYFEGLDPETGEYTYATEYYSVRLGDRRTLNLLLGDRVDQWIDYVQGGFAENEELIVFLCEYTKTGEEWTLSSYRRAKDAQEVRDWVSRTNRGGEHFFQWPDDPSRQVVVYSLQSLRERMDYEELEFDLEDPEVLNHLPDYQDFGGYSWNFAAEIN